jgi:hypothetical protein
MGDKLERMTRLYFLDKSDPTHSARGEILGLTPSFVFPQDAP